MAYIGNPPADRYSAVSYQDLTGGTGTSFTLDYAVGSANEIEVFVNNVRQEPSVAYTVSVTALTMTGSITSTDDFYVVFQSKAQQTATHPAGNNLQAVDGTFTGNVSITGTTSSTGAITATAGIILPSGQGIDFSATSDGSGTMSSELLDDYEEGTWTPTNTAGITLTSTTWYSKIGNAVTINAFINIPTNSSASGCLLRGFPYALSGTVTSSVGVFNNNNEDLYAYFDGVDIYIRNNSNTTKTFGNLTSKFIAFQLTYTA